MPLRIKNYNFDDKREVDINDADEYVRKFGTGE